MFLVVSYLFLVFFIFVLVFASISRVKDKKIQALVKSYVFLTQKFKCRAASQLGSRVPPTSISASKADKNLSKKLRKTKAKYRKTKKIIAKLRNILGKN